MDRAVRGPTQVRGKLQNCLLAIGLGSFNDTAQGRFLRLVLFEGDKETAAKLVDDLYSAGAKEVWVIGIAELGGSEVAAAFVAVLPSDSAARKRVFAVESDFQKLIDGEPSRDDGQKYLHFSFD